MNYVVITRSHRLFKSIQRYICYVLGEDAQRIKEIEHPFGFGFGKEEDEMSGFKRICDALEKFSGEDLRKTIIFFDYCSYQELNPIANEAGDGRLLALLMLTFPEVYWVIISTDKPEWIFRGDDKDDKDDKTEELTIKEKLSWHIWSGGDEKSIKSTISPIWYGYTPLFDPVGIRNFLKRNAVKSSNLFIPERKELAVSIDDEEDYALFNGYSAYRFGYRTICVQTMKIGDDFLDNKNLEVDLVFEDIYFYPPDRRGSEGFSDLKDVRDRWWKLLGEKIMERRVLVTVGHGRAGADIKKNREYLRGKRYKYKVLFKPFAGVFDLWIKSGLWRRGINKPRLAPSFKWPPENNKTFEDEPSTHSTPGLLLMVSERLLKRSKIILDSAKTVADAIHSAVVALEAKEILACRTPTTALKAVALQHQAEVLAEGMFYGIEYTLNVKDRFKDIEREIKALARWFHPVIRKRASINARLMIAENLSDIFHKLNQFEELQKSLSEARKLMFLFWARQEKWRLILYPVLWYIQFCLHSLPRFIMVIIFWIVFFGIIYYLIGKSYLIQSPDTSQLEVLLRAFTNSVRFFFYELDSEFKGKLLKDTLGSFILVFQGFIKYFNLGIFASYIFMMSVRKR